MNLYELKEAVDNAVGAAKEEGDNPEEITVSIQIDINKESIYSDNVRLHYDGDGCASGCVIVGDIHTKASQPPAQACDCEEGVYPGSITYCVACGREID